LIVVEILAMQQQNAKAAVLQIRFPNSAALAAESRGHGDLDNNLSHQEIHFQASLEGEYSYCMRDELKAAFVALEAEQKEQLERRRARIDIHSRYVPPDSMIESFDFREEL
jgi:hypothetical protein